MNVLILILLKMIPFDFLIYFQFLL